MVGEKGLGRSQRLASGRSADFAACAGGGTVGQGGAGLGSRV